jgi:hypothetical protein
LSWVRGSNKGAQITAQNFGIWEWRVNSGAYPELCEVDGDLYWTELGWEEKCAAYCNEINKKLRYIETHCFPGGAPTEPKKETRIGKVVKCLRGIIN